MLCKLLGMLSATSFNSSNTSRLRTLSAWVLLIIVLWDTSSGDMVLAQLIGTAHGFALRDNWFFDTLLHDQLHKLAWLLVLALCCMVWWPLGLFNRLEFHQRLQLAVTPLIAAFVISTLKAYSPVSCPWDLRDFGGIARYLSHWQYGVDGGTGHCFPAGHAASGFAFLGGYFAFRPTAPRIARAWLWSALAAGLLLGLAQQLRGAHFMSHTLWSGFICWAIACGVDAVFHRFTS